LLHDGTSLRGCCARGSAGGFPVGGQDGVCPHPVHPFAHQVDPGVCENPGSLRFVDSSYHGFVPCCCCSLSLNSLSKFPAEIKSAPV
jgi:hypothetical protein